MWPWEHAAFGYLLYSTVTRLTGERPTDGAIIALSFGTQIPDLVDKPLAWSFGVLPSGTSLAHSAFVAAPVAVLVLSLGRRVGRPTVAAGFVVGYWSHLVGDVVYPTFLRGVLNVDAVLWPLVSGPPGQYAGVFARTASLFAGLLELLGTPAGMSYLLAEVVLLGSATFFWAADGTPGTGPLRTIVTRYS
jgi:hypothetical protein